MEIQLQVKTVLWARRPTLLVLCADNQHTRLTCFSRRARRRERRLQINMHKLNQTCDPSGKASRKLERRVQEVFRVESITCELLQHKSRTFALLDCAVSSWTHYSSTIGNSPMVSVDFCCHLHA